MDLVRQVLISGLLLATGVSAELGAVELPEGLSPRSYFGLRPQLEKRGACGSDAHTCLDINSSICCLDTQYCLVAPNGTALCCDIGSDCGSSCAETEYQCGTALVTISGTPTTSTTCCARACTGTSAFLCPSEYGGLCCSFGSACASGSTCVPTSTTSSGLISLCATTQRLCPASISSGGCCDYSCPTADSTQSCLYTLASGSATGISGTSAHGGLSTGARAGIGVGVAVGFCVVVGVLLWVCLVHRRHARERPPTAPAMSEGSRRQLANHHGSDYFGPAAVAPNMHKHASPDTSPGLDRGVPAVPQSPGDITSPVEIYSPSHTNFNLSGIPQGNVSPADVSSQEYSTLHSPGFVDIKTPETTEHRIELP